MKIPVDSGRLRLRESIKASGLLWSAHTSSMTSVKSFPQKRIIIGWFSSWCGRAWVEPRAVKRSQKTSVWNLCRSLTAINIREELTRVTYSKPNLFTVVEAIILKMTNFNFFFFCFVCSDERMLDESSHNVWDVWLIAKATKQSRLDCRLALFLWCYVGWCIL